MKCMAGATDISLFVSKTMNLQLKLKLLLLKLKLEGNRIVGVSASAKGNTLLNYCKIGPEILDYITDINPLKIGKYSPGQHIKIEHDDKLIEDQPEYALMLACNFKKNIVKAVRDKGYKGKFIIPYPELEII